MSRPSDVSSRLAALGVADARTLRQRWKRVFGAAPPPRAGKDLMALALGWQVQAQASRGLSRWAREEISRLKADLRGGKELTSGGSRPGDLAAGTTLVREWNGATYQVLVLDGSFAWDGKAWNSLSEIARAITGTRWNGPAFFGLRAKKQPGSGA